MKVNDMLFLRCAEQDKSQQTEAAAREISVIRKKNSSQNSESHCPESQIRFHTWRSSEHQEKKKNRPCI